MYNGHSLLYYSYVVNKQLGFNGYLSVNSQGAMVTYQWTVRVQCQSYQQPYTKTVGVIYKRNIAMTKLLFVLDVNQTIYLSNQIKYHLLGGNSTKLL